MSKMKVAKNPSDIPDGHHYAILVFRTSSVFIPGDERSRTNPGHGYPDRYENYNNYEYQFTTDREEWLKEIELAEQVNRISSQHRTPYAALEVAGKAKVTTKVVVGVE